jgi:hypothetical protein
LTPDETLRLDRNAAQPPAPPSEQEMAEVQDVQEPPGGIGWLIATVIVAGLLLIAGLGILFFKEAMGFSTRSVTPAASTASASPSPVTSASSQYDLAARYIQAMTEDVGPLVDSEQKALSSCNGHFTAAACAANLRAAQAQVQKTQQDRQTLQVPPCIENLNNELSQGLDLYDRGFQQTAAGSAGGNAAQYNQGVQLVQQGVPHIATAAGQISQAYAACPRTSP